MSSNEVNNTLFYSLTQSSVTAGFSLGKNTKKDNPDAPLSRKESDGITANASNIGLYSYSELRKKGVKILETDDDSPVTNGNFEGGRFSLRNVYLEDGSYLFDGGFLGGRFAVNSEYVVRGQPSQELINASVGQYPVNGQYRYQGMYRTKFQQTTSQVENRQYPVSTEDGISGQFNGEGILRVNGEVTEPNPFQMVHAEYRNGQYRLEVDSLQRTPLKIRGLNVQTGGENTENGQILVNGENSFVGKYRVLNQYSSTARLYLTGEYNSASGRYKVNTVELQDGVNLVSGYYEANGRIFKGDLYVQGRYTSGGQYVIETMDYSAHGPGSDRRSPSTYETSMESVRQTLSNVYYAGSRGSGSGMSFFAQV